MGSEMCIRDRYGNARVTARNLKVHLVDEENNLLILRGAVPGPNGGYVMIRETNKLYSKTPRRTDFAR